MISKEKLKSYANKLMFDMEDNEYETLQQEFEIILQQMELIENIEGIKDVEPMTFPFYPDSITLRNDKDTRCIDPDMAFANCHDKKGKDVRVPRVVE